MLMVSVSSGEAVCTFHTGGIKMLFLRLSDQFSTICSFKLCRL